MASKTSRFVGGKVFWLIQHCLWPPVANAVYSDAWYWKVAIILGGSVLSALRLCTGRSLFSFLLIIYLMVIWALICFYEEACYRYYLVAKAKNLRAFYRPRPTVFRGLCAFFLGRKI